MLFKVLQLYRVCSGGLSHEYVRFFEVGIIESWDLYFLFFFFSVQWT